MSGQPIPAERPAAVVPARGAVRRFFALDEDWERAGRLDRADAVVGLVTLAFSGLTLELGRSAGFLQDLTTPQWVQWLVVVTGSVILVGRRRWPLTVTVLAAAHMFVVGITMPQVMAMVTLQIVYFTAILSGVAWARSRREMALVVGGVITFMFGWLAWQFALGSGVDHIRADLATDAVREVGFVSPVAATVLLTGLVNVLYFGGAVIAGQLSWRTARQQARLAEQADLLADQSAELRRRAVVGERLRIARELHDVVAHHVSVIGVQAGAARRVLDRTPDRVDDARTALGAIEQSSREAVGQMRGLVGTLRTDGQHEPGAAPPAPPTDADRTAAPGVEGLPALAETVSAAGLQVSYSRVESPSGADPAASVPVPETISRSLYRIAQEALANVRRHSTASQVTVVLRIDHRGADSFAELEVTDNGRPRHGTSGSGLGQVGIRERAALHQGVADLGPRVGGGYRVRVRLPLARPDHADPVVHRNRMAGL